MMCVIIFSYLKTLMELFYDPNFNVPPPIRILLEGNYKVFSTMVLPL